MRVTRPGGRIGVQVVPALLGVLVALALQPAVGSAAQTIITSAGPLSSIYINDDLACQVQSVGDTSPSFFGGTEPGGCGTFLALTGGENLNAVPTNPHLFGAQVGPSVQADFKPLGSPSQSLTGSGTASHPYVLTTQVTANEPASEGAEPAPVVGLSETDTYVVGQAGYQTSLAIVNLGHVQLTGTVYHAGDCYLRNQDTGFGAANVPSSGSVACSITAANSPASGFMAFTPNLTTGAGISGPHFLETRYGNVWGAVSAAGTQFPDTVDAAIEQDNGMGLSWPISLAPEEGAGLTFTTTVTPSGVLPPPPDPCEGLGPPSVTVSSEQGKNTYLVGEPASVAVAAAGLGLTTNPTAVHVPISTTTPGTFTVTRSAVGTCGTTNGSFTYTVARRTLVTLPPPVLGKTVNVEPVSGQVLIKLPAGAKASLAGPLASSAGLSSATESLSKGVGFIPLSEARQIPVGSILDSSAGVARIATATATAGKLQQGDFGAGIFKLLQERKQKGLTELSIINKSTPRQVCASQGKGRTAASHPSSKVLGRLKANSHGHFTGRGQYSAATVRGTVWGVENRCDGTLTRVTRGILSVRDFHRRKTITLVTGQSYLAKAPHH